MAFFIVVVFILLLFEMREKKEMEMKRIQTINKGNFTPIYSYLCVCVFLKLYKRFSFDA